MKGRYAGVSMNIYGAILPGAARLARLPAEPSPEAKRRLGIVQWYEKHGRRVRLKARGLLREPLRSRKAARARLKRLKRPPDLKVDQPGVLLQIDSKQVQLG